MTDAVVKLVDALALIADRGEMQARIDALEKEREQLLRVARAAESYCRPAKLDNTRTRRLACLIEALQELEKT